MKQTFLQKTGILALCLAVVLVGAVFFGEDTVPASALVQSRKLPIYCVQTEKPKVSLSFDAAWGNEDTADLLSILEKYNVKTTFFMTGGWVESYPEDVKAISAAGHDLENGSIILMRNSAAYTKDALERVLTLPFLFTVPLVCHKIPLII